MLYICNESRFLCGTKDSASSTTYFGDVAYFMRVDKKDIYRLDNCNALKCLDKVKEIDDIWVNDNETGEYLFNEYLKSLKKYPTVEEIIESAKNRMKCKQDKDDNDKDI